MSLLARTWWVLLSAGCLIPGSLVADYVDADDDGHADIRADGVVDCALSQDPDAVCGDCDDADPTVHPRADELCGDGIDNDCDGVVDDDGVGALLFLPDRDGDGHPADEPVSSCSAPDEPGTRWVRANEAPAMDCDDTTLAIHPSAIEDCLDGVDNDCNGLVDDGGTPVTLFVDGDGDGFGSGDPVTACHVLDGHAVRADDCDDTDAGRYPGAPDAPHDCVDADCAGDLEAEYDADGDGVPVDPARLPAVAGCLPSDAGVDCDDLDAAVFPGAPDACDDGVDHDCDGAPEHDCDGDGFVDVAYGGTDCDDAATTTFPGAPGDACGDGVDTDCDGAPEDDCDADGVRAVDDCDDGDASVWSRCATCVDADGDGTRGLCDVQDGVADCDDADPDIGPHARDWFADGIDQDCSGGDLGDDLDAAIHVTAEGADHAACGPMADPCGTAAFGAQRAEATSGLLRLSEGDFGALDTTVTVLGGHDAAWQRTGHTRLAGLRLRGGEARHLDVVGAHEAVVLGEEVRTHDLVICAVASGDCTAIRARTTQWVASSLEVAGCDGAGDVVGIDLVGHAHLTDVVVSVVGGGLAFEAVGLRAAGVLDLSTAVLDVEGPGVVTGLASDGTTVLTRVAARVTGPENLFTDFVTGARLNGVSADVTACELVVSGGTGIAAMLSGPLSVHGSLVHVGRADAGVGLDLDVASATVGTSAVDIAGTSLFAPPIALRADAPVSVDHSVLEVAGFALSGVGPWSVTRVHVADTALDTLPGDAVVGPSVLLRADGVPVDLAPGSGAVDAGIAPLVPLDADLHDRPRPAGAAWDLGPYEVPW